jgi:hypothetical protein
MGAVLLRTCCLYCGLPAHANSPAEATLSGMIYLQSPEGQQNDQQQDTGHWLHGRGCTMKT